MVQLCATLLLFFVSFYSTVNHVTAQDLTVPSQTPPATFPTRATALLADEDVMVMQHEMAWGATEMKRYKTLRGEWPTKSALASDELKRTSTSTFPDLVEEELSLFRGTAKEGSGAESDRTVGDHYWDYLVSMF